MSNLLCVSVHFLLLWRQFFFQSRDERLRVLYLVILHLPLCLQALRGIVQVLETQSTRLFTHKAQTHTYWITYVSYSDESSDQEQVCS